MKRFLGYWFPVILVAAVIFYSSSMTYGQQDIRSSLGTFFPLQWLEPLVSWISFTYAGTEVSVVALGIEGFVEFFIRKASHLTVFFVLGFFICRLCFYFRLNKRACFWIAFSSVVIYAGLDELHQYFTGDRTPLVQDVIIDSVGGFFGALIYIFIRGKVSRK